jgi:hypothetical protein
MNGADTEKLSCSEGVNIDNDGSLYVDVETSVDMENEWEEYYWKGLREREEEKQASGESAGDRASLKVEDTRIVKRFEDSEYLKHVSVVDSRVLGKELGLDEGKLLDVLYKIMDDVDFKFQIYGTTKTFLCEQLGWVDRHYTKKEIHKKLYEYFESLRIGGRAYNIFGRYKGKDKEDWQKPSLTTGFISEHNLDENNVEVEDIIFTIGYMHRIILANPKAFGKFSIDINVTFKTIQAKRLYDFTIVECGLRHDEFKKTGEMCIEIVGIKEKLHPLLEIGNSDLDNKKLTVLIEKILEEINENPLSRIIIKTLKTEEKTGKTGNAITKKKYVETIKNKKEICGYRYYVIKKAAAKTLLASKKSVSVEGDKQPEAEERTNLLRPETAEMLKCCFGEPDVVAIVKKAQDKYPSYDLNVYIPKCIKYTKDRNPDNFPGYLRTTIEEDHAGFGTWLEEEAAKKRREEDKKRRAEHETEQAELAEIKRQQEFEQAEKERMENLSKQLELVGVIELSDVWQKSLNAIIKEHPNSNTWLAFGAQLFVDLEKNVFLVVPHNFAADQINRNYLDALEVEVSENYPEMASVTVTTEESVIKRFSPSKD